MPCRKRRNCRRDGSLASPNRAVSEQSSPPHSTVQSAIRSSSCRLWRALSCRGSTTSAMQATDSSIGPPQDLRAESPFKSTPPPRRNPYLCPPTANAVPLPSPARQGDLPARRDPAPLPACGAGGDGTFHRDRAVRNQETAVAPQVSPVPGWHADHDHLGDILATLDAGQFQSCLVAWVAAVAGVPVGVVAIDGKTVRRSGQKNRAKAAIHVVSV